MSLTDRNQRLRVNYMATAIIVSALLVLVWGMLSPVTGQERTLNPLGIEIVGPRELLAGSRGALRVVVTDHQQHRPAVEARSDKLFPGLEGALNSVSSSDIAKLQFDLGAASPHLDMLPVKNSVESTFQVDGDPLLQIAGADHFFAPFFELILGFHVTLYGYRSQDTRHSRPVY